MKKIAEQLAAMVIADQRVRWEWNEARLHKKADEATIVRVKNNSFGPEATQPGLTAMMMLVSRRHNAPKTNISLMPR